MNKQEFLVALREKLNGFPMEDLEERLLFYSEMLDDYIEDGLTEEEAVAKMGSIDALVSQAVAEIPLPKFLKNKLIPNRKLGAGTIALLIIGAPLWLPLIITAFALVLSLYAVLWSLVLSFWAVNLSIAVCAPCGIIVCFIYLFTGHGLVGLAMLGVGVFCAGLAIFLFFACKGATYGAVICGKKILLGIKKLFIKKENKQ